MHSDRRWCEWIIGWEDERTPVLAIVVWGFLRASDYVMPPMIVSLGLVYIRETETYSRILLSEGWALM